VDGVRHESLKDLPSDELVGVILEADVEEENVQVVDLEMLELCLMDSFTWSSML
jgi:hypothetical protein